ncbi:uncharacterized protein LTHEOB_1017 [Lasiodiplodia theobromae]|uniref:uncharacterized protein n=1 Tax=Lasiodiplodia theobromae TaxID=45133 RepID=UPI0015C31F41|nr:uncharacterized protein LTHEOB_1017 [Lasiodiplodia theobromae]KAF4538663.1 hypothetical protein LTHEOB_1017 [Lasiodiplodia theobromae]
MAPSMRPDPRRNSTLAGNAPPNGSLGSYFNNNSTQQTTRPSPGITMAPIAGRSIFGTAPRAVNAANNALDGTVPASESLKADSISKPGQSLDNRSVTIMFGPPQCPDQNVMPASMTSKLPKPVLHAIMKSTSKEQSDIGEKGVLICFTSSRWYKNLIKVQQYLEKGEYSPWDQATPLQVVDAFKNVVDWSPWMADAADIDSADTTDPTHKLFLEELTLYNWACFTHYDALKEHSLQKMRNKFPILAREALALVDFLCPETNDFPADEAMKQFTREAVERNKKTIVLRPKYRETFAKAIVNNLPAILLEEAQHDLVEFLRNERTPSESIQESIQENIQENIQDAAPHPLLDSCTLENLINRGALCKAITHGYGTLLPAGLDEHGRLLRNTKFKFATGELLIIRFDGQTFNPPNNVVVENLRGERGDMLKELLCPLDLHLSNGSPSAGPRLMQTARSPQMQVKREPNRSSPAVRGRSHARSRSPEDKDRKYRLSRSRSRSRDRRRVPDRWQNPYGRR